MRNIRLTTVYLDTIEIFFKDYPAGLNKRLSDVQGTKPIIEACRRADNIWGYRGRIHQPKTQTLFLLDDLLPKYHGTLCRFDVAFDFNGISADWLEQRCILRWRRPGPMRNYGDTVYWVAQSVRKKRSNRDIALYADRPSKITGEPDCTHFELRFYGTPAVRREGIKRPSQLIGLDPAELFQKHIKVVDFDDEAAERLKCRFIQRQVKRERMKYRSNPQRDRSRSMREFLDRYRARNCQRFTYLYDRAIHNRVQRIKDLNPKFVSKLKPLSLVVLHLPCQLAWR